MFKQNIVAVLLMTTVHLVLADVSGTERQSLLQEKNFNPNEEQLSNEIRGLPSVLRSIMPFTPGKRFQKWSDESFTRAVEALGILRIPGIKLVKLPLSKIQSLQRSKSQTLVEPIRSYVPRNRYFQNDSPPSNCQEHLQNLLVLAHADQRTAYQVQTLTCMGSCNNQLQCSLKKKTMVVYLLDASNNLAPKTINVGCACVCS